ncbi:MAG: 4Fe-4S binding protein, partial [Desulfobacterales bacterium]|nr:4Fe-4S binding protein [Desulfobacterales bacterium]
MDNMEVYKQLVETMKKRGGTYPGMDIPEFYSMAKELFTPEEAAISNAMPKGLFAIDMIMPEAGKSEEELAKILDEMADKGLCFTAEVEGRRLYGGPPFVPGIMEQQFMRGTATDKDKRIARVIYEYKKAVDAVVGHREETFPSGRVIPIDETLEPGSRVNTYDEVMSYIDKNEHISAATCYCRQEAKLLDENDDCHKPDEVCMQFGLSAQFVADRGIGKSLTKDEAKAMLKECEEAGLIHCTVNVQDVTFICNCCDCHCMVIEMALKDSMPGRYLSSGFKPVLSPDQCTSCGTCVDICPPKALSL